MTVTFFSLYYSFGLVIFVLGLQSLIYFPLTVLYEIWKRRVLASLPPFFGKVSVIVPAYNEQNTIRASLLSLLDSRYPDLEVIVINDGSTDQTEAQIADLVEQGRVVYRNQKNAGKANALNHGISIATGDVILYTDADSLFLHDTVDKMVRWFADPHIDAVCGNDMPLYPQTAIHRFLTITTHIGTGFVRRALSLIGCLQIISGNLGAIRTSVLREIGGFKEIWGEDLEMTYRLHRHHKKIVFDPEARVMAECPGTLGVLWRQRVRWVRSYFKVVRYYKDMFFSLRYWPFSWYLPINVLSMGVVPVLQSVLVLTLPLAYASGSVHFSGVVDVIVYLGLITFVLIAIYSVVLDRAYRDLKLLPYGLLIVPISYFYNAVVIFSLWKEARSAEETWHKSARRDVQQARVARPSRWRMAIGLAGVAVVVFIASYIAITPRDQRAQANRVAVMTAPIERSSVQFALSTHFDAWADWRDAINQVTARPMINRLEIIGIGAGRPDWAHFRWQGHQRAWSGPQKREQADLLRTATTSFHALGARVAAIVDVFGPTYVASHPDVAAVRFDGARSAEQVSLVEQTQGRYSDITLAMIDYIAANYAVDVVALTEILYDKYSFTDADLASYRRFSGRDDWPRDRSGRIENADPSIWAWRSALMEGFIKRVGDVVHRHNKQLYVDVPVSWADFSLEANDYGLDYRRILKHADKIVLWNYYHLAEKPPETARALAEYMKANFPADKYSISLGLWGRRDPADAVSLNNAIDSTVAGGGSHIWITPNDMLRDEHWHYIQRYLRDTAGSDAK